MNSTIHTPYLIQRGTINRPLGDFRNLRLSQAVNLDYMGSAEFEFGALPKSFRAIESKADLLTIRVYKDLCDGDKSLRVVSTLSDEQWELYRVELDKLRAGKNRTKEYTKFEKENPIFKNSIFKTDFWWDIENHVMWSFDKSFMNNVVNNIAASLNYMNEQKKQG